MPANDAKAELPTWKVRETRRAIASSMVAMQAMSGDLPVSFRQELAARMGYSDRTARRILHHGGPYERAVSRLEADESLIAQLADCGGNVSELARRLRAHDPVSAPSRRTLARALRRAVSDAERAQMKKGDRARRALEPRLPIVYDAIGEVYELDGKLLPIECRDADEVWSINVIDVCSALVSGIDVIDHRPDEYAPRRAIRNAILPGVEIGPAEGLPFSIRFDQGTENTADKTLTDLLDLCIVPLVCDGYHPEQKGTIEAFHRWVEYGFCALHPFYLRGPKRLDNTRYRPPGEAPSFEQIKADYIRFVAHYNNEKPHERFDGRTPAEEWTRHL